ncbi:SBBP repeat-containing protein, partial [bacterium]|nr:SBBP repeat-containing protein [bacterium]
MFMNARVWVGLLVLAAALPVAAGAAEPDPLEQLGVTYVGTSKDDSVVDGDMAVGPKGNLFVVGSTRGGNDLPRVNAKHPAKHDSWMAFATRIGNDGAVLWSTYITGSDNSNALGVAVDRLGNAYVTGYCSLCDLPGGPTAKGKGTFVTKLGPAGDIVWTRYIADNAQSRDPGRMIAVSPSQHLYIAGFVDEGDAIQGTRNKDQGDYDAYVTKMTASGSVLWTVRIGGKEQEIATGLTIDVEGNAYVTGEIRNTGDPGTAYAMVPPATTASRGDDECFVSKVGPNGELMWTRLLGGSGEDSGFAVLAVGRDAVYVAGGSDSADFQPKPVTPKGEAGDGFVAKLDARTGAPIWATFQPSTGGTSKQSLALNTDGHVLAGGRNAYEGISKYDQATGKTLWHHGTLGYSARHIVRTATQIAYADGSRKDDWPNPRGPERYKGSRDIVVVYFKEIGATVTPPPPPPPPPPGKKLAVTFGDLTDGKHHPVLKSLLLKVYFDPPSDIKGYSMTFNGKKTLIIGDGTPIPKDRPTDYLFSTHINPIAGKNTVVIEGALMDGTPFGGAVTFFGDKPGTQITDPPPPPDVPPAVNLIAGTRTVAPDETVDLPIHLNDVSSLGSLNFDLTYDPAVVQVVKVDRGDLLNRPNTLFRANTKETGVIHFGLASKTGISGSGPVAYVTFKAVGKDGDASALPPARLLPTDTAGKRVALTQRAGEITIVKEKEKGDWNRNGKVDELDALAALKMSIKEIDEDLVLDMDDNGKVTAEDARRILVIAVSG